VLWPRACGESNEIAGDVVSYLRYLYRSSRNHGADRARPRVALCTGERREQPMKKSTMAAERITAALLLVLCIVFAVFV
jgi:hypothetical protein